VDPANRTEYESDDCQATLWHELTRMNCDYDEIAAAILNPATLTSCVYSSDWRTSLALLPALIAVETAGR